MKTNNLSIRLTLYSLVLVLICSWSTVDKPNKLQKYSNCGMDIFAQNNTSVTVDYVKFESSSETKTFSNLAANGGTDSGVLLWDVSIGFTLSVKLRANPGTGSIKVYRDNTLVACTAFNNPSSSVTITFLDDFSGGTCPGGFLVYIENSSC